MLRGLLCTKAWLTLRLRTAERASIYGGHLSLLELGLSGVYHSVRHLNEAVCNILCVTKCYADLEIPRILWDDPSNGKWQEQMRRTRTTHKRRKMHIQF
jgi:hypothetical protein